MAKNFNGCGQNVTATPGAQYYVDEGFFPMWLFPECYRRGGVTVLSGVGSLSLDRRALVRPISAKSRRARLSGAMFAWALCALAAGGCANSRSVDGTRMSAANPSPPRVRTARIPLPSPALLQHQPAPDCAFRGLVSTPPTAEEIRQKLDYEQQCYRQAETNVRGRLDQLQDSVQETIKAVRQRRSSNRR